MASHSYSEPCPNCNGSMSCCNDTRPFQTTSGDCVHCGFYFYTKAGFYDLEELNAQRREYNNAHGYEEDSDPEDYLKPLSELPEVKEALEGYLDT